MKKIVKPLWLSEGPNDKEYKEYKLLSKYNSLKQYLDIGDLDTAINEIEETLDYLYMYDAIKASESELQSIDGHPDWDNLEFVYSTPVIDIDRDDIIDSICEDAIYKFQDLYAMARSLWRNIEDKLIYSYFYKKPSLLSDGFLFFISEDSVLDIFSFQKPTKFNKDWRSFNIDHIANEKYSKELLASRIEEISNTSEDKILIKMSINKVYDIDRIISVIKCNTFNILKRDYSFK